MWIFWFDKSSLARTVGVTVISQSIITGKEAPNINRLPACSTTSSDKVMLQGTACSPPSSSNCNLIIGIWHAKPYCSCRILVTTRHNVLLRVRAAGCTHLMPTLDAMLTSLASVSHRCQSSTADSSPLLSYDYCHVTIVRILNNCFAMFILAGDSHGITDISLNSSSQIPAHAHFLAVQACYITPTCNVLFYCHCPKGSSHASTSSSPGLLTILTPMLWHWCIKHLTTPCKGTLGMSLPLTLAISYRCFRLMLPTDS